MQTDGASLPGRSRSLVVVSAGLSQPSSTRLLADRLASATERHLGERGVACERSTIELREHGQELMNNLLTGFPADGLKTAIDTVVAADGLVAVTPIFNASYSGLFKLFFDVSSATGWRRCRCSSGRPVARRGTRSPWSTRCGRCSPTWTQR